MRYNKIHYGSKASRRNNRMKRLKVYCIKNFIPVFFIAAGLLISFACASSLHNKDSGSQRSKPVLNVVTLGAKGDGVTDNTKIFQKAIDSVNRLGGGTVLVPAGKYLIDADTS